MCSQETLCCIHGLSNMQMQSLLEKPFPAGGSHHSGSSFLIYVEVEITEKCCVLPALICWGFFFFFCTCQSDNVACILGERISDAEILIL